MMKTCGHLNRFSRQSKFNFRSSLIFNILFNFSRFSSGLLSPDQWKLSILFYLPRLIPQRRNLTVSGKLKNAKQLQSRF